MSVFFKDSAAWYYDMVVILVLSSTAPSVQTDVLVASPLCRPPVYFFFLFFFSSLAGLCCSFPLGVICFYTLEAYKGTELRLAC